ncbi:MAG: hypothetical protein V3U98_04635 [Acidobacteriota bacterium]
MRRPAEPRPAGLHARSPESSSSGALPCGASGARTYRRTLGSRLLALAAALLFAGLCLQIMAWPPEEGAGRGLAVCGLLLLLSLVLVAQNFGDRIELNEGGVRFRNLWRERFGLGAGRFLRWDEVEDVREIRRDQRPALLQGGRAVLVLSRSGRRYVFDSIEGLEELAALLRERAGLSAPSASQPDRRG